MAPVPVTKKQADSWLLVTQALDVAGLAPWLLTALILRSLAAAGGIPAIIPSLVWLAPLWPVAFSIAAWLAYRNGRYDRTIRYTVTGSLYVFPFVAVMAYFVVVDVLN